MSVAADAGGSLLRPLVSIVMAFRDAEATIAAVLGDVQAQTLPAWELVAIDDGSRDAGPDLVRALAARDGRIRLLTAEGTGFVAALVQGCAAAQGACIARMDADDRMDARRLELQFTFLAEHPRTGVVSSRIEFGGDPRTARGFAEHVRWCNRQDTPDLIRLRRFVEMPMAHPSMMFRRELLDLHGTYRDGPFPEDYELVLRWFEAGVAMDKVPAVLLRWNDPPGRLTRSDPRYAPQRHAAMKCRYLALEVRRTAAGRPVWLWGAGRVTRRRFDGLSEHGVDIAGFVDIDPDKIGRRVGAIPVVGPGDVPPPDAAFVISGVAARGARESISSTLESQGRREGIDHLLAG